jgi:hypothetical protein
MKFTTKLAATVGAALFFGVLSPTFAQVAATPAAHPHRQGHDINGTVSAVDPGSNTLTIVLNKLNTVQTVNVTGSTKISKIVNIGLADLNVGDEIRASSKEAIAAGATSITANRIAVISPLSNTKKAAGQKSVVGIVANTTPQLTITTNNQSTITITTLPKTKVVSTQPASFNDIAIGDHIAATGKLMGTSFFAKAITIGAPKTGHHRRAPTASTF